MSSDTVGIQSLGVTQAFLWTLTDGLIDLGTLGGKTSAAGDVNENRWVVGGSATDPSTNISHGFLWTATDGMVDIGVTGARAVNDRGQVVGTFSQNQRSDDVWQVRGRLGICEAHPDQPFPHGNCAGPGMPCENPDCAFSIKRTGLVCPRCR